MLTKLTIGTDGISTVLRMLVLRMRETLRVTIVPALCYMGRIVAATKEGFHRVSQI